MFGLVDGNNFYASCECVFQPALRGMSLVVLSKNDGCAIARSANFGLYCDMSARVVAILREAAPRVEVYSIDESFIDREGVRDREIFARDLWQRVHRWTGIPNCIGIGPTKTLAKVAKSADGVIRPRGRGQPGHGATGLPRLEICGVLAAGWRRG